MDIREAQSIIRSGGYPIAADGKIGPETLSVVARIERNAGVRTGGWPIGRRLIAAAQRVLAAQGHGPGGIDGLDGPATKAAVIRWMMSRQPAPAAPATPDAPAAPAWPRRRDRAAMDKLFGPPGGQQATEGRCQLPFPFVVAWDTDQKIVRFSCNSAVAASLTDIFDEAARHYGEDEFRRLRLDRWGGCFADRMMRGSKSTISTHAWGIAVDLDPQRNQLRWGRDRASFAKPEYDPFWRIVEAHGAVSLGRTQNRDWMHFQFATE